MSVLLTGGDGYLGWPTAMNFAAAGHEVTVADNYLRRRIAEATDSEPLMPAPSLSERVQIFANITGQEMNVRIGDLCEPEFMFEVVRDAEPDTIVHYAEQPSAPYSMRGFREARETFQNNLDVTFNCIWAVKDIAPDAHIIKLGTMGEYGTPNIDIEEGWLEVEHKGRRDTFLFPRQAGSLYHTTKIMDTDLLWYGVRMWDLSVTDLMQGPVYGIETEETEICSQWSVDSSQSESERRHLRTIFNYDEISGTIINRFITQAVIGYPLTVYGKGGQTRGYLNIKDTLQCVHMAQRTPSAVGQLRIFNQIMETFTANELAEKTQRVGQKLGYDVQIDHLENPRKEAEEHYYNPTYHGLQDIGVVPNYLTDEVMEGIFKVVEQYKDNIRKDVIFKGIKW